MQCTHLPLDRRFPGVDSFQVSASTLYAATGAASIVALAVPARAQFVGTQLMSHAGQTPAPATPTIVPTRPPAPPDSIGPSVGGCTMSGTAEQPMSSVLLSL